MQHKERKIIGNIVDKRTSKYDVVCEAIFEASFHGNHAKNATQFEPVEFDMEVVYNEIKKTTVHEACEWAEKQTCYVTIFLYDLDTNVGEVAHRKIKENAMKHRKMFIIAKYADDGAREALNISYGSFSFANSVYGSFSANECGVTKTHYEINEFQQAQIDLERLIAYNPTVGYGIVEVEYEGE